jgi:hypothetical protein
LGILAERGILSKHPKKVSVVKVKLDLGNAVRNPLKEESLFFLVGRS